MGESAAERTVVLTDWESSPGSTGRKGSGKARESNGNTVGNDGPAWPSVAREACQAGVHQEEKAKAIKTEMVVQIGPQSRERHTKLVVTRRKELSVQAVDS